MAKKKGAKKTGGRVKGTPNRVTSDLRQWVNDLLNSNRATFAEDLRRIEPHQRLAIMEKLLSYALPRLQSVESKIDYSNLTDDQIDKIITEITKRS